MPTLRLPVSLALLALSTLPIISSAQEGEPKKQPPAVKLDAAGDPLPAGAVARLGSTRFRHQAPVSFVGYSGDGAILITLSSDNTLRFWDAKRGKELRRLELKVSSRSYRYGPGASVLLSGDGKTLVLGSDEGKCTVIDVASGKTRTEFATGAGRERFEKGGGGTRSRLSNDGKRLLVIHDDFRGGGKVVLWNTETGTPIRDILPKAKGNAISAATFSRDGKSMVCVEGSDRDKKRDKDDDPVKPQLRFISVAEGHETRAVELPEDPVGDMTLTADGKYLIVHGRRGEVRQIDAATGKEVRNFGRNKEGVRGLDIAPDHLSIFITDSTRIRQYDLSSGKELQSFPVAGGSPDDDFMPYRRSFAMAISPDGKTLVVPSQGTLAFFDVKTGKLMPGDDGHVSRIDSIAFSPDGKQVLTGAGDRTLYLWDVAGGKRARAFVPKSSPPDDDEKMFRRRGSERLDLFQVRGGFSPDGKSVAGLWWGDRLHVFDAADGKLRYQLGPTRGATSFSYSPSGRFIALAGSDGTLTLYNAEAGREMKTFGTAPKPDPNERDPEFERPEQSAYSLAFSPDGRMLIAGGMQIEPMGLKVSVSYWEVAAGQERMRFRTRIDVGSAQNFDAVISALDSFVVGLAFSPDGKTIAEVGYTNVKLRDLRTGREIRTFGGNQIAASTARFSPDGKMLIAGKQDGGLRVWDVATATALVDCPAHPAAVTALEFSRDGKWLASGARDSSILLWDWDYIRKQALSRPPEPPADRLESLWNDLADKDATRAYTAVKALAASPAETVPLLKARLKPVPPVDPGVLKKLIDDLDAPSFAARQKAEAGLEKLGDLAAPAIKARQASNPPLDTVRRLEALQKKLDAQVVTQDVLQVLRAIEVLELIDGAEVRPLVEVLAKGAPGHRITEEAGEALRRLARR